MENKELKDRIKFKIAMSEIDDEEIAKMKNKKINILGRIAAVVCVGILISGATFADEISEKIYNIYNFRKQNIVETRLPEEIVNDEERLEEVINDNNSIIPWSENAADVVESQNLEVNITDVAMDDYYMVFDANINFTEEVTEKMQLEDIYLVRFIDLVIRDENDNILFCMEENKLKEIFETDNLDEIRNNPKYCISEVISYGFEDYSKLGTNPYKMRYYINTKLPSIYPKSEKLIFEFSKIALDSKDASIGISNKHYLHQDQSLTVIGDWKIEIDVREEYSKRENLITYKTIQTDANPKNELLYCYYKDGLMHAQFRLASEERRNGPWGSIKLGDMLKAANIEPRIANYIIYKISSSDEFKERENWEEQVHYVDDYYIENSNGKKSKMEGLTQRIDDKMELISQTNWSSRGVSNGILKSGEIPGYRNGEWSSPNGVVFDIAEEDLTDQMTIKIKYLGQDIEFKIEKMKGDE